MLIIKPALQIVLPIRLVVGLLKKVCLQEGYQKDLVVHPAVEPVKRG